MRKGQPISERVGQLNWELIRDLLDDRGFVRTPPLLTPDECASLAGLYDDRERFRSRVDMARFRFGLGEYKYFANPMPPLVVELRAALYPRVAPAANEWMRELRVEEQFPPALDGFLDYCHRRGQMRPTPLILRYDAGGYNCLHQDVYGEVVFPLQFTFMLSRRGVDYDGGQFLLLEQRPRAQSRCEAVSLEQGEAILFATRWRPVKGTRGYYRANVRHGVSTIDHGRRLALGIIFHDAK